MTICTFHGDEQHQRLNGDKLCSDQNVVSEDHMLLCSLRVQGKSPILWFDMEAVECCGQMYKLVDALVEPNLR